MRLHPEGPDRAAGNRATPTGGGRSLSERARGCILIVDDERHARQAMQKFLERDGWTSIGFGAASEVHTWLTDPKSGARGQCSETDRHPIRGAIIDVHLPDGDGIELTRALRRQLGQAVPIVIISGDTSMKTLRRLRDAGANRFVGKPMSLQALREALAHPLTQTDS